MVWEDTDWNPDGLAPEVRDVVEGRERMNVPPVYALSVPGARDLIAGLYGSGDDPEPVGRVWETAVEGDVGAVEGADSIPVRIYVPEGSGPHPVMLWFHGGGFVLGGIDIADSICRRFANAADAVVVSVGYRRAPEHPFPAAVEDCYAATAWAVEYADVLDGDPSRVGIGGGSAGGNLAAAVSLLARDVGAPGVAYQLVVYPMIDDDLERDSYLANPDGRRNFAWYWDRYTPSRVDRANPYAFPLKARDFSGLPPAEVVTAEYDILSEEGREYAEALDDAGVDVVYRHFDDMIHPFYNMDLPQSRDAIDAAAERFRDVVG